ncbi:MAG: 4-hydroxybenzoate polyprenyltransferase [Rickettsiales bacterium]|jgi:4-hydroxybenzoate polyprenyltransferase|nr:4-hydroxybenzoate polyprenyltransferase [Rickettsiales bacterium]
MKSRIDAFYKQIPGLITLPSKLYALIPPVAHPYLRLMRLHQPTGILLLMLPGWWAIALYAKTVPLALGMFALFAIGAVLMRGAGCIINDLTDYKIDQKVERTKSRPLASGEISHFRAFVFLGGLLFVSLLILLLFPPLARWLGVASLVPVILYPWMKRFTWWPQLFLGFTFNWGILLACAAINYRLPFSAYLLYLGGVFWTLGYDTIYGHQDKKDDALIGVKSTARLFGDKTREMLAHFYRIAAILWVFGVAINRPLPGNMFYILWAGAAYLLYIQVKKTDFNDPQSCMKHFKLNMYVGWLVFFAILLGRV